ncbi:uncharacterized protein I303_104228 [Kwoniella dejecticola CBS 10117]|uniref:Thioredoxin domain-containing protein n=1 Tax=Kwoniella dejecticola CBS 10117 TaxID=1296121 RepID=A0A1A6A5X9_9TREE|nr:uncharacterized protein I303_04795 [Kwoniella dejecticola CBS 10117]OBR85459.1 hypothetical protein I303_04795 [Kwoniella dejecticola CBS 10117]
MTGSEMHFTSPLSIVPPSYPSVATPHGPHSESTSSLARSSSTTSSSAPNTPRKDKRLLSRKLPPALTESLENLAFSSQNSKTSAYTGAFSKLNQLNQLDTTPEYHRLEIGGDISPLSKTISLPVPENSVLETETNFNVLASGSDSSRSAKTHVLAVAPPLPQPQPQFNQSLTIFRTGRSSSESQASPIGPNTGSSSIAATIPTFTQQKGKHRSLKLKSKSISGPSSFSEQQSQQSLPPLPTSSSMGFLKSSSKSSSSRSDIILTPKQSLGRLGRSSIETSSASGSSCRRESCGTWSLFDEVQLEDSLSGSKQRSKTQKKESHKEKKERIRIEKESFDEHTPPTHKALFEASLMEVVDEHGLRYKFGDLVRNRKTIVIFIRHWYCPLCAQYMNSILAEVSHDALEEADVDLIIIGNGSDKMLNGYRNKSFRCPFKIYTDPTLALYRALGLTRQTGDGGQEEDKGDYLVQSAKESTIQTIKRATKMPIRNPGHFTQLGGEFIFNGTLNVGYTHRMINTRSHQPIRDICEKAGVRLEFIHYEPGLPPPPVHRYSFFGMEQDQDQSLDQQHRSEELSTRTIPLSRVDDWQKERNETLERMKALKAARRGGPGMIHDARSSVGDNVRIVGQDIEEEEVVLNFGALGISG